MFSETSELVVAHVVDFLCAVNTPILLSPPAIANSVVTSAGL